VISFRTKSDITAAFFAIVAILVMIGTLVWMVFVPLPTEQGIARGRTRTENKLKADIAKAQLDASKAQAEINPLLWTGTVEEVGPQALAKVTQLSKTHRLKLVAFRPQKSVDVPGVTQLPFSITTQGAYLDTMQLVKELETPTSKLAVSLVQVAAADAYTDSVLGTINIVAYVKPMAAPATQESNVKKS
jgi:Tfp pilus assembly protein PilO